VEAPHRAQRDQLDGVERDNAAGNTYIGSRRGLPHRVIGPRWSVSHGESPMSTVLERLYGSAFLGFLFVIVVLSGEPGGRPNDDG
jgi:hypothetical protein